MAAKKEKTYTVATPVFGVSLRENPDGKILNHIIQNGEKVKEISNADGWVEVEGGWIRAKYLK